MRYQSQMPGRDSVMDGGNRSATPRATIALKDFLLQDVS